MARSLKKGPYFHYKLEKKLAEMLNQQKDSYQNLV